VVWAQPWPAASAKHVVTLMQASRWLNFVMMLSVEK
jgi:hypothetical protein